MRKLTLLVAAFALIAAGCSPRLIGATTGDAELHAFYSDVQDLGVGSSVMMAGVRVGAVVGLELEGYRARATFSLPSERAIPVGTVAALAQTTVLGEWIVDLRVPTDADRTQGPFYQDGDELPTAEEASLEALADKAADILGAIQANDLSAIVEAAHRGIGGRGENLNRTIADLAVVADALATQRQEMAAIVDGLGRLGAPVAEDADALGELIDELAGAGSSLATNRDKFVAAVRALTRLASGLNEEVLLPHGERLGAMVRQLDPVVAALADNRHRLEDLIDGLDIFQNTLHKTIISEMLTLFIWLSGICEPTGECVPLQPTQQTSVFDLLVPHP